MLYGRDPRLPTEYILSPSRNRRHIDLKEYGSEMAAKMSQAWEVARQSIGKAQKRQKAYYDKRTREPQFVVGERVFLLKPSETTGASRKFARPFHGPYRITGVDVNNAYIRRVDHPQDEPVLVALQRLRRCPDEVADEFWPPDRRPKKQVPKSPSGMKAAAVTELDETLAEQQVPPPPPVLLSIDDVAKPVDKGKYTGVLRRHPRTADAKPGDV